MKKQWRTTIILIAVLAAMLLVWLGSTLLPGTATATSTASSAALPIVFKAEAAEINSIEVSNQADTYTLLPKTGTDTAGKSTINWFVQDMNDYPFSAETVNSVANVGQLIEANKEIAAGVTDLALYGLDSPKIKLSVMLKNGEKHTISFGNEIASGSYNYAVLDNSGTIYAVATGTVEKVNFSFLDLLDKSLIIGIEEKNLNSFSFERSKDNLKLVTSCRYSDGTTDSSTTAASLKFKVLEPIKKDGNSGNLTVLAQEVLTLKVNSFVELNPSDLAKYGLDQPLYTFKLGSDDKSVTLKIGKKADDNNYYMISDAIPAVFTAATTTFSLLDMKITEMIDTFVALESISKVDQIKVDLPAFGLSFISNISVSKDQNASSEGAAFTLDGQNATILNQSGESLFSELYQRIIGITIDNLDPQATPKNTHDAAIVYSIKADVDNNIPAYLKKIEFAKRDDYTYYVFIDGVYAGYYINGETAFLSEKRKAEGIVVACRNLKYAIEHAVNGVFNTEEGYPSN